MPVSGLRATLLTTMLCFALTGGVPRLCRAADFGPLPPEAPSLPVDSADGPQAWHFRSGPDLSFPSAGAQTGGRSGGLEIGETTDRRRFGFWESPLLQAHSSLQEIAVDLQTEEDTCCRPAGAICRARFRVRSDQSDPRFVPLYRFRISGPDGHMATVLTAESTGDGSSSSLSQISEYTTYFQMPSMDGRFRVHFDVANLDPEDEATARFLLEEVEIQPVCSSLFRDFQVEADYTFREGPHGWTMGTMGGDSVAAQLFHERGLGHLGLAVSDPHGLNFGFWSSPLGDEAPAVRLEGDRLYWAEFVVLSTEGDTNKVPTFRCRLNESGFRFSQLVHVSARAEADLIPTALRPTFYPVFFPAGVGSGEGLIASIDLHSDPSLEGTSQIGGIFLEGLTIYSVPLPSENSLKQSPSKLRILSIEHPLAESVSGSLDGEG